MLRVPIRRVLGSTGMSVVVHLAGFLLLGLIIIGQNETLPPTLSQVRFEDFDDDDAVLVELPDLELPVFQSRPLSLPEFKASTNPEVGRTTSELSVDLTPFSVRPDKTAQHGIPAAIAGIASGIQEKVKKAGGRRGEVQFSLAWQGFNDVDLHVITPSGEHISYSHRTSRCQGKLDVDMNASAREEGLAEDVSDEPVENVRWLDRSAPTGRFTVIVHQFRWRNGRTRDPFQLLANLGDRTELVEQTVTAQNPISIHRFQYVRSTLSPGRREKLAAELTATQAREEVEATAILDRGIQMAQSRDRDRVMMSIISRFPHTDASIRAMQELDPPGKNQN